MARFMARNSKWPENIFYGQRGANMARFEKSGHQMANLAALVTKGQNGSCSGSGESGESEIRVQGDFFSGH